MQIQCVQKWPIVKYNSINQHCICMSRPKNWPIEWHDVVVVVVVSCSHGRHFSIDQQVGDCCQIESDPVICFLGDPDGRFLLRSSEWNVNLTSTRLLWCRFYIPKWRVLSWCMNCWDDLRWADAIDGLASEAVCLMYRRVYCCQASSWPVNCLPPRIARLPELWSKTSGASPPACSHYSPTSYVTGSTCSCLSASLVCLPYHYFGMLFCLLHTYFPVLLQYREM